MNFFLKILAITRNLENEIVLYSQNSVKEKKKGKLKLLAEFFSSK
jgi:hypothetical protein